MEVNGQLPDHVVGLGGRHSSACYSSFDQYRRLKGLELSMFAVAILGLERLSRSA